jgi:hypothetical protein
MKGSNRMTSDVAEHFVYLGVEAASIAGTKLLTRQIGQQVRGGEILVALDAAGEKHLLIPVEDHDVPVDDSSQGVVIAYRELMVDRRPTAYVDVHCRIPQLGLVFERLLDDILGRLEKDELAPVDACHQALDDWRSLLRAASQGLSRETVVGLIGELEVLRLLGTHSAVGALGVWRGPDRSVHDFTHGGAGLEVKTTASLEGDTISVASLDQLDPSLVKDLHLVVLHVKSDETALTLDQRIDHLIALGFLRGQLLSRIEQVGYIYESDSGIDDRYSIRSIRAWQVGADFPGIRSEDIPELRRRGVANITYRLSLAAAPDPLTDQEFGVLLDEWTRPLL